MRHIESFLWACIFYYFSSLFEIKDLNFTKCFWQGHMIVLMDHAWRVESSLLAASSSTMLKNKENQDKSADDVWQVICCPHADKMPNSAQIMIFISDPSVYSVVVPKCCIILCRRKSSPHKRQLEVHVPKRKHWFKQACTIHRSVF